MVDSLQKSLAPSTWSVYNKVWKTYTQFFHTIGQEPCLPYKIVDVMYFIAHLWSKRLAPDTITSQISAISFLHKVNNLDDPVAAPVIQKMLQGLKKQRPQMDDRLPVTRHVLSLLCRKAPLILQNRYDVLFIRAFALVAFHGFFRLGELVHKNTNTVVHLSDVSILKTGMQVTIPCSKTSVKPEVIFINRSAGDLCPVAAVEQFISVRGRSPGPLFAHADGLGYPYSQVNLILANIFASCGLDSKRYKGHSFRIGAASEAAKAGYSDAQICLMGRWKSDAFRKYIRLPF